MNYFGTYTNRFEFKYIVSMEERDRIIEEIQHLCIKDPHTNPQTNDYTVYSTYFDTFDFKWYNEKIEGKKIRKKIRLRYYNTDHPEKCSIEIKRKNAMTVLKSKFNCNFNEAIELIKYPSDKDLSDRVMQEIHSTYKILSIAPKLKLSYERKAFLSRFDHRFRLSFDSILRTVKYDEDKDPKKVGKLILPPHLSIMEVKFNSALPLWFTKTLENLGVSPVRISKYCLAVEKLYPDRV